MSAWSLSRTQRARRMRLPSWPLVLSALCALLGVIMLILAATAQAQSLGGQTSDTRANPPVNSVATGQFRTTASAPYPRILDPQGKEFVPIGANIGITGAFDWGGSARGHAADAVAWGWNTVRLNVLVSDALPWSRVRQVGYQQFFSEIDDLVREYTARKIVVIIDSHDLFMGPGGELGTQAPFYEQINRYWKDAAQRYRSNPYVWFNLHNEPPVEGSQWFEVNRRSAEVIRSVGAQNPIMVDAQVWGQDLGKIEPRFANVRYTYEPQLAPELNRQFGNVILSQHNYGSYGVYTSAAAYAQYVNRVRAAGIPLVVGEFGFRMDGVEDWPLQTEYNTAAAQAVAEVHRTMRVGALWWHANHSDGMSLKRDGSAFYEHGPGGNLSEAGRLLWSLTH